MEEFPSGMNKVLLILILKYAFVTFISAALIIDIFGFLLLPMSVSVEYTCLI